MHRSMAALSLGMTLKDFLLSGGSDRLQLCGPCSFRELLKQYFGFFEDRRIETFGEPVVDRRD
jgi:hypothetical protein